MILRRYRQRWACEEVAEFLKGMIGPKRLWGRRQEAMSCLMILAMLATGILIWSLLRSHGLTRCLFAWTNRLLDKLQEFARLSPTLRANCPPG